MARKALEVESRAPGVWSAAGDFRVTPHRPSQDVALRDRKGKVHEVEAAPGRLVAGTHALVENRPGVLMREHDYDYWQPVAVLIREWNRVFVVHQQHHVVPHLHRELGQLVRDAVVG